MTEVEPKNVDGVLESVADEHYPLDASTTWAQSFSVTNLQRRIRYWKISGAGGGATR